MERKECSRGGEVGIGAGDRRELSSLIAINADMDLNVCWGYIIVD